MSTNHYRDDEATIWSYYSALMVFGMCAVFSCPLTAWSMQPLWIRWSNDEITQDTLICWRMMMMGFKSLFIWYRVPDTTANGWPKNHSYTACVCVSSFRLQALWIVLKLNPLAMVQKRTFNEFVVIHITIIPVFTIGTKCSAIFTFWCLMNVEVHCWQSIAFSSKCLYGECIKGSSKS